MRTLLVVIAFSRRWWTWGSRGAFMTSGGMFEANPLVVMIVGVTRSSSALIAFKVSLTGAGCAALWKCRRSAAARRRRGPLHR